MTAAQEEFVRDGYRLEWEFRTIGLKVKIVGQGELCYCLTYGCECFKHDALEALLEESAERPLDAEETAILANLKEWALQNGWRPEVNNQRRST